MVLWAGCEDVCRGVADQLRAMDPGIEFLQFDAARDENVLARMPDLVKDAKLDLLVTWGTRVTRQMVGTKAEFNEGSRMGDMPVVFTVVSDPVASDIVDSYTETGRTQITGTRNRVPEAVNINGLRRVMPDFNHLGLIYEPEADNSLRKFEEINALSKQEGFHLTAVPVRGGDPAKLQHMATGIAQMKAAGVQFIYLGSSTFLETHADTFTETALSHGLPVLSPYEKLVHESQAYLSIAARDYDVGKLAAQQAMRILNSDAQAGSYPVLAMEEFAFVLNGSVAKKLSLYPPLDMMQLFEVTEGRQ
nr:ABC transporter substrate binding protein [Sedimentitalea sp. CY04]